MQLPMPAKRTPTPLNNGPAAKISSPPASISQQQHYSPYRESFIPLPCEIHLETLRFLTRHELDRCQMACRHWRTFVGRHFPESRGPRRRARKFEFTVGTVFGGREVSTSGFVETNSHKYKRDWLLLRPQCTHLRSHPPGLEALLEDQRVFTTRPDTEDVTLQVYPLGASSKHFRTEMIVKNRLTKETAVEVLHFISHVAGCYFNELEFDSESAPTSPVNPLLLQATSIEGYSDGLLIYTQQCRLNDIYTGELLANFHAKSVRAGTVGTFMWKHPSEVELKAMVEFVLAQREFCQKLSFDMHLNLKKVKRIIEAGGV